MNNTLIAFLIGVVFTLLFLYLPIIFFCIVIPALLFFNGCYYHYHEGKIDHTDIADSVCLYSILFALPYIGTFTLLTTYGFPKDLKWLPTITFPRKTK